MNFFQGELLTLFRGRPEFRDARYVGRACYVPLPDGTKIKAEFVTGMMGNQYDALRLTAISPTEGKIRNMQRYLAAEAGCCLESGSAPAV